ncbi:MAG: beta-ketoacyl-[acyl-carrier-protein] synthase family protein [Pirellulales bacterium]
MSVDSSSSQRRSVVITGLGVVSPLGVGTETYWNGLLNLESGVRRLTHYEPEGMPVTFGGEVPDFDGKTYVRPRKALKVMSREIQFAFAAADLAMQHAGLSLSNYEPERLGVVFCADMIYFDVNDITDAVLACKQDGRYDFSHWADQGMPRVFPLWLLKYLPNMPACHIAIAHDARAACNSVVIGETSPLVAFAEGLRVIERGLADVVLVGGTGYQTNTTNVVFRSAQETSKRDDDPPNACRPFDLNRDGQVYGEGAAALILESAEHAAACQAKPLAEVVAYAVRQEPRRTGQTLSGSAIRDALTGCLEQAGIGPEELSHVNAHGIGKRNDDAMEAQAISDVVGRTPVWAIKGSLGNCGSAGGALELVADVLAMNARLLPALRNVATPDPGCPINVYRPAATPIEKSYSLKVGYAPTGQAAAVLLKVPQPS